MRGTEGELDGFAEGADLVAASRLDGPVGADDLVEVGVAYATEGVAQGRETLPESDGVAHEADAIHEAEGEGIESADTRGWVAG